MDIPLSEQEQLIAACKEKKAWAMKELYELYAPTMMGVCVRYVQNRETAKDVMQEGFIKVFTHIKQFRGSGSFEGWMRRIFVTTALEHIRNEQPPYSDINEERTDMIREEIEISVIEKLSAEEIMNCILELSTNLRLIFNLYAIEGYSHSEIANMLNIKESTSRTNYMRARRILQEKLQNSY